MAHVIYPYLPPRMLSESLWQVRGSLRFPIPRNMTIWRAPDGRLVLYSVVAMYEDGLKALEALGTPSFMVIPHKRHHMDAPFYKARYPGLRVLAETSEPANGVRIDGSLQELASLGITGGRIPGTSYEDMALDLPAGRGRRALCVCELLGNVAPKGTLAKLAFGLLGPPGGGFGLARAVRVREVVNRELVRAWLLEQAERADLDMILVGHGEPVIGGVAAALRRVATVQL